MSQLEKVKGDFQEVIKLINKELGDGYAVKNPDLVKHLMDKIQQQEDRALTEKIHTVKN